MTDACTGGGAVVVSDLYDEKGQTYTELVYTRKSKFIFSLYDLGADGLCSGREGSFEVSVDNVVMLKSNECMPFIHEADRFGDCPSGYTSKPTNTVRFVSCSFHFFLFSQRCYLFHLAHCQPNQQREHDVFFPVLQWLSGFVLT